MLVADVLYSCYFNFPITKRHKCGFLMLYTIHKKLIAKHVTTIILSTFLAACSHFVVDKESAGDSQSEVAPLIIKGKSDSRRFSLQSLSSEKRITLSAVGDIQMGRAWPVRAGKLPSGKGEEIFANIKNEIQDSDIVFGNLETVLADTGESKKCRGGKNCFAFRVPENYSETIKSLGINLLSMNNNHSGDFGAEGLKKTAAALSRQKIKFSGNVNGVSEWVDDGLRYGFVAFSTGPGLFWMPDIENAVKIVRDLSSQNDIVIVSYHGGAEGKDSTHITKKTETYFNENRGNPYMFSHAVVDAGADVVLGHGPHVLRAMEVYKGRFIAYSLGNFSAWSTFNLEGPLGKTVLLELIINDEGEVMEADIKPIKIRWPGIPELAPHSDIIQTVNTLSKQDIGIALFDKHGHWEK